MSKNQALTAEIIWAMKTVDCHYSFKSSEGTADMFKMMFPDSDIAKQFQCAETKCRYLTTFGIAPHFLDLLTKKVKGDESGFVLLFDESLNAELQKKQLDFHLRSWHHDRVVSRYFGSSFMGHASADDLMEKFEERCSSIGFHNLLQVSMDGPNVNWKLHRLLEEQINRQTGKTLLNVGSCGLHILHNAFRIGSTASGWDIEHTLSSLRWLFKDSPARREDYTAVTKSAVFPLDFCRHRWLENVKVTERALEILPLVEEYTKAAKLGKVTEPTNKSFQSVTKLFGDPLICAKLNFFLLLAKEVSPFLTLYQTDRPMLPFLSNDLGKVLRGLMERVIKPEALAGRKEPSKLLHVEWNDSKNQLRNSKVKAGFAAERIISQLTSAKKVSEKQVYEFRDNCKQFVLKMISKIVEKSPITYSLVRNMVCLDPANLPTKKEPSVAKLTHILRNLVDAGQVSEHLCDPALTEYSALFDEVAAAGTTQFDHTTDRLDTYYHSLLDGKGDYKNVWYVIRKLLLISHGQASVERGFSVNKEVMVDNLSQRSLIAQRVIHDHVRTQGGILNVSITKELLLSAGSAYQKYSMYLESLKAEKAAKVINDKKRSITDDVSEMKAKRRRMQQDISVLVKEADTLADKAETTGRLLLITKSNSLRRTAKEKGEALTQLDTELDEKIQLLKETL